MCVWKKKTNTSENNRKLDGKKKKTSNKQRQMQTISGVQTNLRKFVCEKKKKKRKKGRLPNNDIIFYELNGREFDTGYTCSVVTKA